MSGFQLRRGTEVNVLQIVDGFKTDKWTQALVQFGSAANRDLATIYLRDATGYNLAQFSLLEMVNCCGALISTNSAVEYGKQGKGIGQEMQRLKEHLAREMGYSLLICTVVDSNDAQKHVLEKAGWVKGAVWKNRRTLRNLAVWTKQVAAAS